MLVLVTLASILMACMRAIRVPAEFFLLILVFVAGVLAGQVLLFRGRKPLAASGLAGAFLLPGEAAIMAEVSRILNNGDGGDFPRIIEETLLGCICTVPAGIALGTVTGILAGGIYAQADGLCRRLLGGTPRIRLLSLTAEDIDLLLEWVRGPKLLQRWSAGQLTFPLDRRQLLQRLDTMSGESPARLMFKAVEIGTGNPVGYIELGRIDHRLRVAFVELPLVAPAAADRDLLAIVMLKNVAEKAFRELGFLQLNVRFNTYEDELAECCLRAWDGKYDYMMLTARNDPGARYLGRLKAWR